MEKFKLSEGLNLISGNNGTGKTKLLEDIKTGTVLVEYGKNQVPLSNIVYISQNQTLPHDIIIKNYIMQRASEKFYYDIVEFFNIKKYLYSFSNQLTAAEQQLILIATAFASGRKLILMDSPIARFDNITKREVMVKIKALSKILRVSVVITAANVDFIIDKANSVLTLGELNLTTIQTLSRDWFGVTLNTMKELTSVAAKYNPEIEKRETNNHTEFLYKQGVITVEGATDLYQCQIYKGITAVIGDETNRISGWIKVLGRTLEQNDRVVKYIDNYKGVNGDDYHQRIFDKIKKVLKEKSDALIIDVPLSDLDYKNKIRLYEMLKDYSNSGVVLIHTTDIDWVGEYSDHVIRVLSRDKVVGYEVHSLCNENLFIQPVVSRMFKGVVGRSEVKI